MKKIYSTFIFCLVFSGFFTTLQGNNQEQKKTNSKKTETTQTVLSDTLDVIHYDIHLTRINYAEKNIHAFAKIKLVPKVADLKKIALELKNLEVEKVIYKSKEISNFYQCNERINIPLSDIQKDKEMELEIHYQGKPFCENWGGFHFEANSSFAFNLGVGFDSDPHNLGKSWFPCVDDFKDRATYDIYITAPEGQKAVASGILVEEQNNDDMTTTFHWKMNQSLPTYLMGVAIGNYEVYKDEYNGQSKIIPIEIYVQSGKLDKVEGSFQNLKKICAEYEAWFGDYPFEKIGYVSTKLGAMEHATSIAIPHSTIDGSTSFESLFAHELSHMWFGNKVTCASAEDMWLNEGWAVFCEMLYRQQLYGQEDFIETIKAKHFFVLTQAHKKDGGYFSLYGIPTQITYGKTVYDKGSMVVQALRTFLGDEVFFDAVKKYLDKYAYNYADTYQLRDFLTETTGRDMTGFFENYVFTPGTPFYSIDSLATEKNGDNYTVKVYSRKRHKGADFIGNGHFYPITFIGQNWQKQEDSIMFNGKNGCSTKQLDFEPICALIDYKSESGDATKNECHVIKQSGEERYRFMDFVLITDIIGENDSALIQLNHNYIAPDKKGIDDENLKIAKNHYWKVDGILPQSFKARAKFYCSKSSSLNKDLFASKNDSIVLLYRPNSGEKWDIADHYSEKGFMAYSLFAKNLQRGEYALGLLDKTLLSLEERASKKQALQLSPNPVKTKLEVKFTNKESGKIFIIDQSGKQRLVFYKDLHKSKLRLDLKDLESGLYIIRFVNETNQVNHISRFVVE
ncbi:MAG: M1 family aminopeptidase [Bacteroidales bacterium]